MASPFPAPVPGPDSTPSAEQNVPAGEPLQVPDAGQRGIDAGQRGIAAGYDVRSERRGRRRSTRPDAATQCLMLLATIGMMLAAARFAVPSIVQEIRYAWHRGELRAEYEAGREGLRNVSLEALGDAYEMVSSVVAPAVVHIEVAGSASDSSLQSLPGLRPPDEGSGVVADSQGHVLTNRHVITAGGEILVTLSDGRRRKAEIVGTDPLTDLAVLKIEADELIPVQWGDSDRCRVGSPVWAVGSPFGLQRTVTFGILSGKHRMVDTFSSQNGQRYSSTQYQDFMQSDVAVNPGNSGGPLVDARGNVIGINTAIVGDTYQGVSFSIPSNVARKIFERLRDEGHVERGWLGVSLVRNEAKDGVGDAPAPGSRVLAMVDPESPAAKAGLEVGDLIVSFNGREIHDTDHLIRLIGAAPAGASVTLEVVRDGESIDFSVLLGTRPPQPYR